MDFILGIAVGWAAHWAWVKFGKPMMDNI